MGLITEYVPRDVMLQSRRQEKQVIKMTDSRLDELVSWAFPGALWVDYHRHSDDCYTLFILDVDYSYTGWRAHLSLDLRWTLSPADSARVVDMTDL